VNLIDQIDKSKLPKHVAVIMDGNGRWAKKQNLNRIFGHKNGITAVREICEASAELGIKYLTLYSFSKENWQRPKAEVDALMSLLIETINSELKTLMENKIRLRTIGDMNNMPENVVNHINKAKEKTATNDRMDLFLALNYGARWEITEAAKQISIDTINGDLDLEHLDENMFGNYLSTGGIDDPELLIRTGGERRISNFLLWQISYAELYFTEVLWPDFRKADYYKAIVDFQSRNRRFGKIID
jgi:undecaprenyl diphosphate synthase